MPAAQPVNYLLDDQEVLFRTGGGGKLAAATRRAVVAFQADQIDSGWAWAWPTKSLIHIDWLNWAAACRCLGLRIAWRTPSPSRCTT
jgi:hypothetical protein